ncbi:MAG: glycoside hydrolase family 5 protein [Oscillospiraceae bacterium]|nr:glycoside hydrolase family 5 protein [Oscillospiraceae bacterium]
MKFKKILANFMATVIMAGAVSSLAVDSAAAADKKTEMRNMSTMEIVNDMGIGINLGNTFESCGDWIDQWGDGTPKAYETAWGSPVVTEDMIKGYKKAGFDTLRIPVGWSNLMSDDGKYTISKAYMERVNEVVDWALDADLYVIINLHWDGGWLENVPTDFDNCLKKYEAIWKQVSKNFKNYGDKLIFESQNEELGWISVWNHYGGNKGKEESYDYVNKINQKFVDVVRKSGGNNGKRHLLISGYNTDIEHTCDPLFKMPKDEAKRCAVSVHYYNPSTFAILTEDASWGKSAYTWGTKADFAEMDKQMDMLKKTFVDKGIPVIIGEYGCPKENKDEASVRRYLSKVCDTSLARGGICPVLWDITGLHYDRDKCVVTDKTLQKTLVGLKKKYSQKNK